MAQLSYVYTSEVSNASSVDLSTFTTVAAGNILKIENAGGIASILLAQPGTDYLKSVTSTTGILTATPLTSGIQHIDLPGSTPVTNIPAHGDLMVGNGTDYVALPITTGAAEGYVLTIADISPYRLAWLPGGGGGDVSQWATFPASTGIDANGNSIYGLSDVTIALQVDDVDQPTNGGVFNVNGHHYPSFTSSVIDNHRLVTAVNDIVNYGAHGSLLYGNGVDFSTLVVGSIVGEVLTVGVDDTLVWGSAGGDPATWSTYPARQKVDMFYTPPVGPVLYSGISHAYFYSMIDITALPFPGGVAPVPDIGDVLFYQQSGTPLFSQGVEGSIQGHVVVTTSGFDAGYDDVGNILVGNGNGDFSPLAIGSPGDVLTSVGGTVAWESPTAFEVDAVVYISDSTQYPTYVYANGTAGVGATITVQTLLAIKTVFNPLAIDNVGLVDSSSTNNAVPVGTRILWIDNTAPAYNGLYTVTTAENPAFDGNAAVLTRDPAFNTAVQMIPGVQVYSLPNQWGYFGGQTFTFDQTAPITVGTTPLTFKNTIIGQRRTINLTIAIQTDAGNPFGLGNLFTPYGGRTLILEDVFCYGCSAPIGNINFNNAQLLGPGGTVDFTSTFGIAQTGSGAGAYAGTGVFAPLLNPAFLFPMYQTWTPAFPGGPNSFTYISDTAVASLSFNFNFVVLS